MSWVRIDDGFEDHPKVDPLSDAAHRLWLRAACWCKKPTNEHTLGFVPRGMLRVIARNSAPMAQLEKLAQELVDAKGDGMFDTGLWEVVEGGWRFHDWATYQPENDEERIKERRSAAGRKGAAARWGAKSGANAEPSNTAHGKHHGTAHDTASFANGKPMAKNAPVPVPDPKPEDQTTSQPEARPDPLVPPRPRVLAGLLGLKISAQAWVIPDSHRLYAEELGLSEREYQSAVADFREKTLREGHEPWLSDLLCRFIERSADKRASRSGPIRAVPVEPLYENSPGIEPPDIRARREAGLL